MQVISAVSQAFPYLTGLFALAVALYAGYDLAVGADWRGRLVGTAARVWIFAGLGIVAVESLIFGKNAVLVAAYQLGVPLWTVQGAFLGSLAVTVLVWTRE
jgi:hypothetical protein